MSDNVFKKSMFNSSGVFIYDTKYDDKKYNNKQKTIHTDNKINCCSWAFVWTRVRSILLKTKQKSIRESFYDNFIQKSTYYCLKSYKVTILNDGTLLEIFRNLNIFVSHSDYYSFIQSSSFIIINLFRFIYGVSI